jgi:hypothetical protein
LPPSFARRALRIQFALTGQLYDVLGAAADIVSRHEPGVAQIVRLVKDQGWAFDPDALAAMNAAYHAVLQELQLVDRGDAGTLTACQSRLSMMPIEKSEYFGFVLQMIQSKRKVI